MSKIFTLKPNLSLINADFEGYKLKIYCDLNTISYLGSYKGFNQIKSDVGYLHTRLISLHNHIHPDPFNKSIAYVFNANYQLHVFSLLQLNSSSKVLSCFESDGCPQTSQFIVPPSISFPSQNLALASNGFSKIRLYDTGERQSDDWKKLLDIDVENSIIAFSILHESSEELHLLLISVVNPEDLKKDESLCNLDVIFESKDKCYSMHKLQWLTLSMKENKWDIVRKRILVGSGEIEFLALTKECDHIVLISKEQYSFVHDSMKKIESVVKEKKMAKCIFRQCSKTITVWLNITETNLEEIEVELSSGLELLHSGMSFFKRNFFRKVDLDSALWKLEKGKIEINVTKSEEGTWDLLFENCNDNVEEIAVLDAAQQELLNAAGGRMMTDMEGEMPAYNSEELEDCDDNSEESLLMYMNGESHSCCRLSILSAARPLFTTVFPTPGFCIRHDVDGVLWTLDGINDPTHSATFNAFGYVKASKTMAKYTSAPSDNSYVAVSDVRGHVYVFYQSRTIDGQLRNRRSGMLVPTYAQQLVITLKNQDEVMGIYTVKEGILVLNQDKVTFYSLPINA